MRVHPLEIFIARPHANVSLRSHGKELLTFARHLVDTSTQGEREPLLSFSEATRRVGISRLTLWLAVKAGLVSIVHTTNGDYKIDRANLDRVFRPYDPIASWLRRAVY